MPTYEYACPGGHRFERFVRKISDAEAAPACPECGKVASRLISGAGLVFKGSGFYITDYGKDGKKGQAASPGEVDGQERGRQERGRQERGRRRAKARKSDAPAAAARRPSSAPAPKPKGGE